MKKIIIIDHEPLTVRRQQIFYIEELRAAGFDVEFWDCSQYFHPRMELAENLEKHYARKFELLPQIEEALSKESIQNTIFIVEVFELFQNRKFFRALHKHDVKPIRMWMYSTAILKGEKFIEKLTISRITQSIKGRTLNLLTKLYFKRHNIVAYDKVITTDRREDAVLTLNHPDWEMYKLAFKQPLEFAEKKFIVFLDEYFPLHPDCKFLCNFDFSQYSESYLQDLNDFFDRVEKQTSMEVIIAAHPKSKYDSSTFNNRKVIRGKTNLLVKESQGVIMHRSAAVAYVAMFDKPLLITTSNQMEEITAFKPHYRKLSRQFGAKIYNISVKTDEAIEMLPIDNDLRETYIHTYLTTPASKDKDNATMLFNYFSSL